MHKGATSQVQNNLAIHVVATDTNHVVFLASIFFALLLTFLG